MQHFTTDVRSDVCNKVFRVFFVVSKTNDLMAVARSELRWWKRAAIPVRPEISIVDRLKQVVGLMAANGSINRDRKNV